MIHKKIRHAGRKVHRKTKQEMEEGRECKIVQTDGLELSDAFRSFWGTLTPLRWTCEHSN